ncbi:hypothetical protein ACIP5Y_36855 [Nocardia sp. NPDC088792]|uniref:hypothetical protein n=1 Tax=Nocardia sp. NPDC088792 TaxID=3364332 RepID=UPI0038288713
MPKLRNAFPLAVFATATALLRNALTRPSIQVNLGVMLGMPTAVIGGLLFLDALNRPPAK